jgi:plastocyanin
MFVSAVLAFGKIDLIFDSGDQQPGTRTDITFATPGDFEVLCAIHPKMRLVVHVN